MAQSDEREDNILVLFRFDEGMSMLSDSDKEKGYANLDEEELSYEAVYDAPAKAVSKANRQIRQHDVQSPVTPTAPHESPNKKTFERSFERERQLSEFKRDREFIILSIQSALKSRNHKEAQEIVYQYRLAAEIDQEFRRLARLTKSVCIERGAADDILFILDSTPDDDHVKRYALYERLLDIDPSNQEYRRGFELAQKALNLEVQLAKPVKTTAYWIGFVISILMVLGTIGNISSLGVGSVLYILFSLAALFFIFPPQWVQYQKKIPAVFNGASFFILTFIIFVLTAVMN